MKKYLGHVLILASFFAFLDQISKYFVLKYLNSPQFLLEYSENMGIAFGIPMPKIFLTFGSLLLVFVIIYFNFKELYMKKPLSRIALSLIVGGAIGNIIDRFTHGFVVDFIAIWKWPNFNLADSFITVGILLIIVFYAKIKRSYPHSL